MSGKAEAIQQTKNTQPFGSVIRAEFPLLIGLGTVAIFLVVGSRLNELTTHALPLLGVFVWLFAVILWSAMCVVRHADCLAIKLGEPYGTLILTLSAISIEVRDDFHSDVTRREQSNAWTRRNFRRHHDCAQRPCGSVFAAWRAAISRTALQHPGCQCLPQRNHGPELCSGWCCQISLFRPGGPTFSTEQEIFFASVSLLLTRCFLLIQTLRHRGYFLDVKETTTKHSPHHYLRVRSTGFHAAGAAFVPDCCHFPCGEIRRSLGQQHRAISHATGIWRRGHRCAGALSGRDWAGSAASLHNQLQRSINILFGSVLATIGLTIPAVLMIGLLTKRPVALGRTGWQPTLLLLTLAVSVVTFTSRKTNVLQGCIHLLLFAVFVLLIFAP
jgi:Ca2+:H+ antiporter